MIIVITGPTAVGKTKLSIALAKKYNAEIIMIVFKYIEKWILHLLKLLKKKKKV